MTPLDPAPNVLGLTYARAQAVLEQEGFDVRHALTAAPGVAQKLSADIEQDRRRVVRQSVKAQTAELILGAPANYVEITGDLDG